MLLIVTKPNPRVTGGEGVARYSWDGDPFTTSVTLVSEAIAGVNASASAAAIHVSAQMTARPIGGPVECSCFRIEARKFNKWSSNTVPASVISFPDHGPGGVPLFRAHIN